jgi:hypothetical protein
MSSKQNISDLMKEIGPAADLLAVDEYGADNSWRLLVDEDFVVVVELDEALDVLVFTADVALAEPHNQLELYKLFLRYNRHWEDTGVIIALEAPDDTIVQVYRHPAEGLEISALARIVADLSEKSREWRRIAAGPGRKAEATEAFDVNAAIRI